MSSAAPSKKVRAAKRKTTPSKEAPKAKRGDGQKVSSQHNLQVRGGSRAHRGTIFDSEVILAAFEA